MKVGFLLADHEISKLMWIAVVVALAASIYFIARPQINTLAGTTFDNVGKVVQGIKLPGSSTVEKPNPDDEKWVDKGNYGENGKFVRDAKGNVIVYAIDDSKPITVSKVESSTSASLYVTSIDFISPVKGSGNLSGFFNGLNEVKTITGLEKFDMTDVTDMSYMFNGSSHLTEISGIKNWDVSKVESFEGFFENMSEVKTLDLSNWNTKSATNMGSMFYAMRNLKVLDVSNFNTSQVSNVSSMFYALDSLTSLNLSGFDLSNVTYVDYRSNFLGVDNPGVLNSIILTNIKPFANDVDHPLSLDDIARNQSNDVKALLTPLITNIK